MLKKIIVFFILGIVVLAEGEKIDLGTQIFEKKNYNLVLENRTDKPSYDRLIDQTKAMAILSLATVAVLYVLPEEFTGWNRDDIKNIGERYSNNVKNRGVVWDGDNMFFNLVGHPYVGSCYYIVARKSGFTQFDSFLYSFLMSTFFWESGVEAFAESPSIQDIIITPGTGALLGEYLYRKEIKILNNDGKIANSKFLGKTVLILIDPIGSLANTMGYKDDEVRGAWSVYKENNSKLQLAYNFKVNF